MQDISQIREWLDTGPLGLAVVARDRRKLKILYLNGFFKKLGPSNPDDGLADFWPGRHGKDLAKSLVNTVLPASRVARFGERWLNLNFQQIQWENQDAVAMWADDVSGIKEAEGDLRKAVEDADKAAEAKSNFLATMSHEMRTPMQAVFGLLELIALEKPSAAVAEMVEIAKSSASGMLEILDDILDLAKIDAEKMELDMFEVPVRTLARGVVEALSVKAKNKPVILVDEIDEDVPAVILGDPKRLRQILLNLTGNALKFTEKGTVKIRISTQAEHLKAAKKGVTLRFEIVDSGIGMAEATKEKLFGSFVQADNSTARKYGGTGLGLSICKKLVGLMNGKIGVESREGEGSTFWFEIPTEEIRHASSLDMPDLKGISVLSVEDHPQGAREIVQSLRSMGASVESCPTYAEAMALVKRRPFDVGIIDQGLPDGLGIDLIRDILELRPFMGLFMYTVRDDAGLLHSLQGLGIQYVVKPASRLGLGQKVLEAASRSTSYQMEGPKRLLIAEDTPSVRDLLRRQLKVLNVEADFVENGREALAALATGAYGILFTDLHMPEMDGYELAKTLRDCEKLIGAYMPIVVLTADIQMMQRQVYLDHGFDECLLKPVTLGHFKRLLMRWGLLTESEDAAGAALPTLTSASLNMEALIGQMGAFDESAKEMLQFFVVLTEPLIGKLQKAFDTKNIADVVNFSHSLKGSARSACALRLGDIASAIQDDAEKGLYPDSLEPLLSEFENVRSAVKALTGS